MTRKSALISLIVFVFASVSYAQRLQPEVLSVDGGSVNTGDMIIDWTLGEVSVSSYHGSTQRYTEGFHQPMVRIEKAFDDIAESPSNGTSPADHLILLPNPASDQLLVRFPQARNGRYIIEIWSANGTRMFEVDLDPAATETEVDIHHFTSGLYFIHVIGLNDGVRSVYKLVKIN